METKSTIKQHRDDVRRVLLDVTDLATDMFNIITDYLPECNSRFELRRTTKLVREIEARSLSEDESTRSVLLVSTGSDTLILGGGSPMDPWDIFDPDNRHPRRRGTRKDLLRVLHKPKQLILGDDYGGIDKVALDEKERAGMIILEVPFESYSFSDGPIDQPRVVVESENKYFILDLEGDRLRCLEVRRPINFKGDSSTVATQVWIFNNGRHVLASAYDTERGQQSFTMGRVDSDLHVTWNDDSMAIFNDMETPFCYLGSDGHKILVGKAFGCSDPDRMHVDTFVVFEADDNNASVRYSISRVGVRVAVRMGCYASDCVEFRTGKTYEVGDDEDHEGLLDLETKQVICVHPIGQSEIQTTSFGVGCEFEQNERRPPLATVTVFDKYHRRW